MREFIAKLPKTTITTIISALLIYGLGEGFIGQNEAELISTILVALGLGINLSSGKFK